MDATSHSGEENAAAAGISAASRCVDEDEVLLLAMNLRDIRPFDAHFSSCDRCAARLESARREVAEQRAFADDAQRLLLPRSRVVAPSPAEAAALDIPGYRIERETHRGGQGVVYAAVQDQTNRPVAIKVLLAGTLASLREQHRFEREIEIASSLRHPNIVTLYEGLTFPDGRGAFAMELIDGVPVDRWADEIFRKNPAEHRREVVRVAEKLARAVQYAHSRAVIHRDLKPGNVLVDRQGEPHILDFGLARRSGSDDSGVMRRDLTLTRSGEFAGTPEYAAPEQIELHHDEVDARVDVYALGLMLYRMLCGRHPLDLHGSLKEILDNVCQATPVDPSIAARQQNRPAPDTDLSTIMLKAIARDRERRYSTAGMLADDLRRYAAGEAIDARRDSIWYVLNRHLARHRREAALAVTVTLLVLTLLVGIVVSAVRAGEAGRRAELAQTARVEQAQRAQAVSLVIAELLARGPEAAASGPADPLASLRTSLETGWLSERPALAAQVHGVLAEIYALQRREFGWAGESSARHFQMLNERMFGEADPRTLRAQNALIAAMLARGRIADAEPLARGTLATFISVAPRESADTRALLARTLLLLGRTEEAEPHAALALSDLEHADRLDPSGMRTHAHRTMSLICERTDRPDLASLHARLALGDRWRVARDTDGEALECLRELARLSPEDERTGLMALHSALSGVSVVAPGALDALDLTRRADEPLLLREDISRRLLDLKRELFGDDAGIEIVESLSLMAQTALAQNLAAQSARLFERAGDEALSISGRNAMQAYSAYARAADLFGRASFVDDAARLGGRAVETLRLMPIAPAPGGVDAHYLAAAERLHALWLCFSGQLEAAEASARSSVERFESLLGRSGHVVAFAHAQLAEVLLAAGKLAEANSHAHLACELGLSISSTPLDQRSTMLRVRGLCRLALGQAESAAIDAETAFSVLSDLYKTATPLDGSFADAAWTAARAHGMAAEQATDEDARARHLRERDRWRRTSIEIAARYDLVTRRLGGEYPSRLMPWNRPPIAGAGAEPPSQTELAQASTLFSSR